MMNKLLLALIVGLTINIACANLAEKSDLVIHQIHLGKTNEDIVAPLEYSIHIDLENKGNTIDTWKFGFYMPRSFLSLTNLNLNPNLFWSSKSRHFF